MKFAEVGVQGYGEHLAMDSTPLNQLAKDLVDATSTTVIREAAPGIPGVVRKTTQTDEYGGQNLLDIENPSKLDFTPNTDPELGNKKPLMEAKEIEYRQERNLEELKRIGIFIHTMNAKNKQAEKKMRELEVQLNSVECSVESMRNNIKLQHMTV